VRIWWAYDRLDAGLRQLLLATTLSWVPLLNLYFGIYDSILILQSLIITAVWVRQRSESLHPLIQSGLAELTLAVAIVPWFSQNLAAQSGVPLYSLLIMLLGSRQLYWIFRERPELLPFVRRSI
jgi:hypothetical protein